MKRKESKRKVPVGGGMGLSLDDRIELTMSHLTRGLDWRPIARGTALEGLPYTLTYMGKRLAITHAYPDLMECPGRYLTALTLCREACPTFKADGRAVEAFAEHLSRFITRKIDAKGQFVTSEAELATISDPDQIFSDARDEGVTDGSASKAAWYGPAGVEYNGHLSILMEGLVRWWLRTGDKETRRGIERAIQGRISDPASSAIRAGRGMVLPGLMTPLTLYGERTGDTRALRYLDDVGNYFIRDIYPRYFPDGKHAHGDGVGHLHCRMGGIAGLIRWGRLIGRPDYVQAAEDLLTANTAWGTEFGFMPERHVYVEEGAGSDAGNIYQPWVTPDNKRVSFAYFARPRCGWDTCELCVTADAIDAAMQLALAGRELYWDVAERYLNHVFRTQIVDTAFMTGQEKPGRELLGATFSRVREIARGGFLSASSPTWAVPRLGLGAPPVNGREGLREGQYYGVNCSCCHGWGARTLGLVWENSVTENGRTVNVNLPFSRKTNKVEVRSCLPTEGRIAVRALQNVNVFVRIPDWVEHGRVAVRPKGGAAQPARFKTPFSDYVNLGRLSPGEEVEVTYPLRRQTVRYHVEYHPSIYEADWLGNTVTDIREIPMREGQGTEVFEGLGRLYS